MYRTSALPQGACPRCYEPLEKLRVGDRSALGCRKCGGAFLDNVMSQDLVRSFDSALALFGTALARGKAERSDHADVKLSCPHCAASLAPIYVQSAACRIDACAEHGTWFDAGEVLRVGRAYRKARSVGVVAAGAEPGGASATIRSEAVEADDEEPNGETTRGLLLGLRALFFPGP